MSSMLRGIRWGLDRMLSVGYGVVYDYIFERFQPYQDLQRQVMDLVVASVPGSVSRREFRILDVGCGPGNFSVKLAQAGFTVVGVERYDSLVELAREKRRAKHLANLAFQHADLANQQVFKESSFDHVVNIHSLYTHPAPDLKLREACRLLKPGGHAVFVNHTRRIELLPTFRTVRQREGVRTAVRSLVLWVGPNAIFETIRKQVGPTYWEEDEFAAHVGAAGFTVLEVRRTFLNEASLLVWARKDIGR